MVDDRHASSTRDAVVRLETLSLMSDVEIPIYVARAQVASAIDLVVQLARYSEDGSRKVTRITEVLGLDERNQYVFRDLFGSRMMGRARGGQLVVSLDPSGEKPSFAKEPFEQAMDKELGASRALWATGEDADS